MDLDQSQKEGSLLLHGFPLNCSQSIPHPTATCTQRGRDAYEITDFIWLCGNTRSILSQTIPLLCACPAAMWGMPWFQLIEHQQQLPPGFEPNPSSSLKLTKCNAFYTPSIFGSFQPKKCVKVII